MGVPFELRAAIVELIGPEAVKVCSWDGCASYCTPSEAWALLDGSWVEVLTLLTWKERAPAFDQGIKDRFGKLPPLPAKAFRPAETLVRGMLGRAARLRGAN